MDDNYREWDRILSIRFNEGEGESRPPILTPEMAETCKQFVQNESVREATHKAYEKAQKTQMDALMKRQMEFKEMLRVSRGNKCKNICSHKGTNLLVQWVKILGLTNIAGLVDLERLVDRNNKRRLGGRRE